METPTPLNDKHNTWIYLALVISSLLPALLAVRHIGISPDSMVYALISEEILSGNGIRLPMIYSIKDNFDFLNGTIPYVGEPPLLPILLALLGSVTPESFLAAQILNVISHSAITIFTFLLMKKMCGKSGVALLTGILVSTSLPLLSVAHKILSDPICIALTLAMIYFLVEARYSDQRHARRYIFFAGLCTSAAILARFAGASLVPVFLWGVFTLARNKRIALKQASTILAITLPFLVTGTVFLITFLISGSIHGWIAPSPDRTYIDAFTGTLKMILLQFHLGERPIALISIAALICTAYITLNKNMRREFAQFVPAGLDLIILFIASQTALITHAMAKSQTVFELRYMSPIAPFLFMLCILVIIVTGEMIRRRGFTTLSLCTVILSLGLLTCGNLYKTYIYSEELFSKQLGHYRILNSPTYQWIKENIEEQVVITSNRPYHLSFFGGYSTIRLPHRRYNKNYIIPENMESYLPNRMSFFGSRLLVLFEKVDKEFEGDYLAGLFNKRANDDNFVLLHSSSDGIVYFLKE